MKGNRKVKKQKTKTKQNKVSMDIWRGVYEKTKQSWKIRRNGKKLKEQSKKEKTYLIY